MSRTSPMLLVVLIWAAGLGAAAQFGKISVLFEDIRQLYSGHSPAELGLVVSVVGMVGLIFGTTAGMMVTRVGAKRALVAALVLGALVSLVEASLPPYPLMIAARVLEGVSHLAIVVVGPTMIAGLAPEAKRPFAMTLWSSFFAVTYAVLALVAPGIIGFGGPPALFYAHAAWMAVLALVLALMLPADPPRLGGAFGNLFARHLAIYLSPRLAAPAMGFVFYTFLYVAFLTLIPPAAPPSVRALLAAGMPLVSIGFSLTLGVWLLSQVPAVRIVQGGYLAAIPGFLLLWLGWGHPIFMVLAAFMVAGALGIVQGASFAAIPELNTDPESRAEAAGAVAQLGNLGTTSGTPILAAVLAGQGAWAFTLTGVLCCSAGIVLHNWQAARRRSAG